VRLLDVRLFVRGDYETMKSRRQSRGDPPDYFDNLVWPAYLDAHKHQFVDGDPSGHVVTPEFDGGISRLDGPAESRRFGGPIANMVVLPSETASLEEMIGISCSEMTEAVLSSSRQTQ